MLKTKVCFKCKKEKTIDNFYKHPKKPAFFQRGLATGG
jgi:hypothetical protein